MWFTSAVTAIGIKWPNLWPDVRTKKNVVEVRVGSQGESEEVSCLSLSFSLPSLPFNLTTLNWYLALPSINFIHIPISLNAYPFAGHQCLRRLQCQCPQDFRRGPHCGSNLIGAECPPDVTFICRFGGSVRGRDVCPNGCANGKCVDVSGGDRSDGPEVEEIDTDGDDTVESEEIPWWS